MHEMHRTQVVIEAEKRVESVQQIEMLPSFFFIGQYQGNNYLPIAISSNTIAKYGEVKQPIVVTRFGWRNML